MEVTIVAVSPGVPEARELIRQLDLEIAALYPGLPINGIDADEFDQAGGYFVIARENNIAIGCGAIRPVTADCVEIKRMFVCASARRRGIARQILRHLEREARNRNFRSVVLETGHLNREAIQCYAAAGYFPIPPFLGYVGSPISRCFAKSISD